MDPRYPEVTRAPRSASGFGVAGATVLLGLLLGCSGQADAPSPGAGGEPSGGADSGAVLPEDLPYARSVESFTPGEGAGFNEAELPDVVLGPPGGGGQDHGSLDVLSLGAGGEIMLGFGEHEIFDGPGPDLIVFENPFWPGGDATKVYAELGEVSVSEDGETWQTFACDTSGDGQGHFAGCAGVTPTRPYDAAALIPLDEEQTGGDAFDLADLAITRARFVKIRDLRTLPAAGNSSGFDLDAVGLIHTD